MLTPAFELSQDEDFITIVIKAPFAKISETEIFIEDCEFKFYSKPYYLRLNLPGNIVEDGRETADYTAETGVFSVRVAKATAGQYFDGLDMLTKLLAPSGRTSAAVPLIEPLDGETCEDGDEDFDWQIEQCAYDEEEDVLLKGPTYGFANQRSGILKRLQTEIPDMIDLADADSVLPKDRRELRQADEQEHFDDDYYVADLYENEAVQSLLDFRPWWEDVYKKAKSGASPEDVLVFTAVEKEKMRQLPRKEYVLDERDQCTAFLSLIDIIFAYAYDHRTTEGENNVESGWTIRKLSATLSWLESYSRPEEVVTACYRRCLSYPLYRHWKLTARVFRDVRHIFSAGQRCLLKCLLDIHSLLMDGDCRYILNDLYITDYCVWIQQVSEKKLSSLARSLTKVKVIKSDVDLELELLEQAAELAVEEQEEAANQITDRMTAMTVTPRPNTSGSESQKDAGRTNDDNIARLAAELQINNGSDETEKNASCESKDTIREEDKQQKTTKCVEKEPVGKGREIIQELPGKNDCSLDIAQNIEIASDFGKTPIVSCSSEVANIDYGSEKDKSHDAVESGEEGGDDSGEESSCECSSSQYSDDTDSDSSGGSATGDRLVCQQDATGDRSVCQQDATGDRPVCQQDATKDRPVCQQDATGDRPVCQQDNTVTGREGQQDLPCAQIKDTASLNF